MSWIYLSHVLDEQTPLYGKNGQVSIKRARSIENGDSSNNSELSMPAHAGTHIDAPYHFDQAGVSLELFPPEFWQTDAVWLMEWPCDASEILDLDRTGELLESVPVNCELLLIRTGFENKRASQVDTYTKQGPGLGADVARWLRQQRRLKYLGMDFISTSSFSHRETGREAHREFLCDSQADSPAILLVEDMALGQLQKTPASVWIVPLRFSRADGAPVTVLAKIDG